MDTVEYAAKVAAGAAALVKGDEANWELARLTREACGPSGKRRQPPEGMRSLDDWARAVRGETEAAFGRERDFSATTASRYRSICEKFPNGLHQGKPIPWTEAWDRVVHKSPEKGKQSRADGYARYFGKHASPEVKRKALAEYAETPEGAAVIAEAIAKPEVRAEIAKATDARLDAETAERKRKQFDKAQREARRVPIESGAPALAEAKDGLAAMARVEMLSQLIDAYVKAGRALVTEGRQLLAEVDREAIAGSVFLPQSLADLRAEQPEIADFIEALVRFAETGRTDLDAFLSGVLKGA